MLEYFRVADFEELLRIVWRNNLEVLAVQPRAA